MNEAEQHLCRDCVCVVKMQRPKEAHTTGRSDIQQLLNNKTIISKNLRSRTNNCE